MKKRRQIKVVPKSPEKVVAEFLGSGTTLAGFDEYYVKHSTTNYRAALNKAIRHTADELADDLNRYLLDMASGPSVNPYLTITNIPSVQLSGDRVLGLNFV